MAYEPKTIKFDLDGHSGFGPFKKGEWAVFYQELLHGTQREVSKIMRRHLNVTGERKLTLGTDNGNAQIEGNGTFEVDLTKIDWEEANDTILLGQIKEWSFGPVDQETLDTLLESTRKTLVDKCNELYGASVPLAKSGVGN